MKQKSGLRAALFLSLGRAHWLNAPLQRQIARLVLECGDNDQREAAPLWLFGLLAVPTATSAALPKKRRGARRASLPAALQMTVNIKNRPANPVDLS